MRRRWVAEHRESVRVAARSVDAAARDLAVGFARNRVLAKRKGLGVSMRVG